MVKRSDNRQPSAGEYVPADVMAFVRDVAALWESQLRERLAGIYLIGSLAHGGYSPRYRDIDMLWIVEQVVMDAEVDGLRAAA